MTFYTLNYIQNNQNTDRAIFYILMLVAASAMIIFTVLYLRDRFNTSDVLVNSTTLTDGMIVRIDSKNVDYQLNLNEDRNTYTLTQAHVIDHRVDVKN